MRRFTPHPHGPSPPNVANRRQHTGFWADLSAMESFKSVLLVLVWLPFFALNLVIVGVFIPVNKQFCAVREPSGGVGVESGWKLSILSPLTAINTPTCVRNTVSREILGWTGIWPLGTPEEQVREQLRKSGAQPLAPSS